MDTANCRTIRIGKGLTLPLSGAPRQEISDGPALGQVAVLGPDYVGMRPTMAVAEGDSVRLGQVLFEDKKTPGVLYTSPGSGRVAGVNRGAKRALLSVVIELSGDDEERFERPAGARLEQLDPQGVRETLVRSGLWTALRTRPFSKVPTPEAVPEAVFVTAIDTHPLAASPEVILSERPDDFIAGLKVLGRLGGEKVYLCQPPGANIPGGDVAGVERVAFEGPHPAGLPGTHIHLLSPVGRHRTVWHVNYQDVMAVGVLFQTGRLDCRRVISLAGPRIRDPRLIRTRVGARLGDLVENELEDDAVRIVSGSVLSGRAAQRSLDYLGRYHLQVTALSEGTDRQLLGWYSPGWNKYSALNVVASRLLGRRRLPLTTTANGGRRAIYPIGTYEQVMPLDIIATFLLRALAVDDIEQSEALGALELDEEDLALCTYVCPGKNDYGPSLRRVLAAIEKEG